MFTLFRLILLNIYLDLAFSSPNFGNKELKDVLETYVLSLHEKYAKQIFDLERKFEEKIQNQDERIISLQQDLSEKTELINHLTRKLDLVEKEVEVLKLQALKNDTDQPDVVSYKPNGRNLTSQQKYNALKADVRRQGRLLQPANAMQPNNVIAFYAYISATIPASQAVANHVLVFDIAKTNIGNAYHPHTGIFIVPEAGVYVFTWNLPNGGVPSYHTLQLVINSEVWGAVHAHSVANSEFIESTGVAVVQANAGDDVFVRSAAFSYNGDIVSNKFAKTFFAGWKL
ncbi:hypothetical protein FSP39_020225 [Pinctada imbricata]|uniref:C1q domain-containing protein n=1 Tax=Pinctada imbricata TaxID=66713 RepID=A0AA88Y5Y0_PINIB|nr:hypothetical protein FSP39_020225 [Pinctada imbricata]